MKPLVVVGMAWHAVRTWFLESLMVILGVALAVGVTSAALGVAAFYRMATAAGPPLLEISVQASEGSGPADKSFAPFTRVDERGQPSAHVSFSDIEPAKAACPDVEFGYLELTAMVSKDGRSIGISVGGGGKDDMARERGDSDVAALLAGDYFAAAGLRGERGSLFSPSEELGSAKVAVLGSELAKQRFPSSDPVGQSIDFFGETFRVVGVLAPVGGASTVSLPLSPDGIAFVPVMASPVYAKMRYPPLLTFTARSVDSVGKATDELQAYFDAAYGAGTIAVHSGLSRVDAQRAQTAGVLFVIAVLAAAGLLIATLNIMNLMIARVLRREKGIAVAVSMGATRSRLFSQSLLESGILSVLGGVGGIGLAVLLSVLLRRLFGSAGVPERFSIGAPTMVLAFGMTVIVTMLFGLYPALLSARSKISEALKAE